MVLIGATASDGNHLTLSLGYRSAEAMVIGQGGEVGDVSLGRLSTIIKPISVPTEAAVERDPIEYTVGESEDLKAVAVKYQLTVEQVRWSNPSLTQTDKIKAGDRLLLPPVQGVVVTFRQGDSLEAIAGTYKVEAATIVEFNRVRDAAAIAEGTRLVVPGGTGPAFYMAPPPVYVTRTLAPYVVTDGAPAGDRVNARFPWGYCTWYVSTKRFVPWLGNAIDWWPNAAAMGFPEGMTPRVGAIMVTRESYVGHVAYVESVDGNGGFTISEMNYKGFGIVDQRSFASNPYFLVGFIY
jgi:LysM repeat protein